MTADPTPLTPEEIKALVADATPGAKWVRGGDCGHFEIVARVEGMNDDAYVASEVMGFEDAKLFAASFDIAHTALSAIAERDALLAALQAMVQDCHCKDGRACAGFDDLSYPSRLVFVECPRCSDARALLKERTDHD